LKSLKAKSIIVTGGSSGVGLAVCNRLTAESCNVEVFDLQKPPVDSPASWSKVNVADVDSVQEGLHAFLKTHPTIDGLVTCAAIDQIRDFLDVRIEDIRKITEVNYYGTFICVQQVGKTMIETGTKGSIVTIASMAARGYRPLTAHYAAAKAAVVNLATSASLAFAPHGIRVNCVIPGMVETPMMAQNIKERARMFNKTEEEVRNSLASMVPLGRRFAKPEEIASMVAFLLSDEASYITGESFGVTGGTSFV
jgi:NAD(P)-dependent dehydrogenase (short-subunit alcohol dehydrogenase family)